MYEKDTTHDGRDGKQHYKIFVELVSPASQTLRLFDGSEHKRTSVCDAQMQRNHSYAWAGCFKESIAFPSGEVCKVSSSEYTLCTIFVYHCGRNSKKKGKEKGCKVPRKPRVYARQPGPRSRKAQYYILQRISHPAPLLSSGKIHVRSGIHG
jgi:hypothetical protein